MKEIILFLVGLLTITSANASVLPENWVDIHDGFSVNEKDLGTYEGVSQMEGADFYTFKKIISTTNMGFLHKQQCYYMVRTDPKTPYLVVSCSTIYK